ncbi:MAG TPA: hypothetical protein VJT68_00735 [Thermoleophilaceae bacterium]|nr:hypothetical protein [Thermoleophilaceae bacterium]
MRSRILLALALVAALIAVPVATGATKKRHALEMTARMAVISESGARPLRWAGEVVGKPTGRSALVLVSTASGPTSTGKAVLYTKHGTVLATTENAIEPQPDGAVRFPGTFKVTGGTGRYRGATGGGTFDGTVPANSNVLTAQLKGKIRY